MSLINKKKKGDYLTAKEFSQMEAYHLRQKLNTGDQLKSPGFLHAVAHDDIPPFSVFAISKTSGVASKPVPKITTALAGSGIDHILLTNGHFEITSGDEFEARVISTTHPTLLSVGSMNVPRIGFPCGAMDHFYLNRDHVSGLVCLSEVFEVKGIEVVWAIKQTVFPRFQAVTQDVILPYDLADNKLGSGFVDVVDGVDPELLTDPFTLKVWNHHVCSIPVDSTVYITPVINIGYCVTHPDFEE